MSTTPEGPGGARVEDSGIVGDPAVRTEIERRLDVITAPDYDDPARRNFTPGDWLAFAGFLAVCAVAFTVWGY